MLLGRATLNIDIVVDAEKHPMQARFIAAQAYCSVFVAGRRGGKTMGSAIKAAIKLVQGGQARREDPSLPPYQGLVTAPDYNRIFSGPFPAYLEVLRRYQLLVPEQGIGRVLRGNLNLMELGYDLGTIYFRSTDDPDTLRGGSYIFCHMDEARNSPEEAFDIITPSVMQRGIKPQIWIATSPIGFDHWTYYRVKKIPDAEFFSCSTDDNNYLTSEQKQVVWQGLEGAGEEWIRQEWYGEYVVITGLCRFNTKILREMLDQVIPPAYSDGLVEVYKEPMVGRAYIAGADSAEGIGRDASCCQILDAQTGEQVCVIHGQIAPAPFAELVVKYCTKYNRAWLNIPSDPIDQVTLARVETLGYNRLGNTWKTVSLKPVMETDLAEAISAGAVVLHRKNTVQELLTYVRDEHNNYHAAKGCRDDEVSALMAAWQLRKEPKVFLKGSPYRSYDYVTWRKNAQTIY